MYGDQFGEFVCGYLGLRVKGNEEINSREIKIHVYAKQQT